MVRFVLVNFIYAIDLTILDFGYQIQVWDFHTFILRFTTDVQSTRCHGKLRGLLLGWDVPSAGNWPNPALVAILPSNIVLQPRIQHDHYDHSEGIQR